mgnify:CR=1 FL=1
MKNKYCDTVLRRSHVSILRWHDYDNTVCYTCNAMVVLKAPLFDLPKNTVLNVKMIRSRHRVGAKTSWGPYTIVENHGDTYAFRHRQLRRRIRVITKGGWTREGS